MAQSNKTCSYCTLKGHSKYYCPTRPKTAIKNKEPAKRIVLPTKLTKGKAKVSIAKKPKTKSRSKLVKELDDVFSKYIRLKDADEFGIATCVTSGARGHWKTMQAGHFYSRGRYPTRWDETNVHVQSVQSNIFLKGDYINYTKYMIDRYGREYVDELGYKSLNGEKIPTSVIKEKIAEYKLKVAKMLD